MTSSFKAKRKERERSKCNVLLYALRPNEMRLWIRFCSNNGAHVLFGFDPKMSNGIRIVRIRFI